MRYLVPLTFATLASLFVAGCATTTTHAPKGDSVAQATGGPNCRRLARPGDTRIQIYCLPEKSDAVQPVGTRKAAEEAVGDLTCRRVAKPDSNKVDVSCGTAAQWAEFDTQAVNGGVTCRWWGPPSKGQPQELCLRTAQWQALAPRGAGGRLAGGGGSNWPGSGVAPSGSQASTANSYGFFPAGGAIGQ